MTIAAKVRVMIADDHPLYREALARAVQERSELEFVGATETGRSALAEIANLNPDVAVLDLKLPDIDGIEILEALGARSVHTRVVLLSGYMDSQILYRAIGSGAAACFSKLADASEICDAIVRVASGETVLPPEAQGEIAKEIRLRTATERPVLTEREQEILRLTAGGGSAPEVAARLGLSSGTVKTHLRHIYEKLGVSGRAAAVAEAMRRDC